MTEVVIVSAVRTAIGRFLGTLSKFPAQKLGGIAIDAAVQRAGIAKTDVDEVIMGNVLSAGLGQNPARQAALHAELPYSVGCFTVNKVCGSGLKSVMLGAQAIKCNDAHIVVAGGMENMTRAPYLLYKAREGYRLGNDALVDAMVNDGLWDVYNDFHMGMTGEIIADRHNLTREDIDKFALRSHQLAVEATRSGKFKPEIVPVEVPQRKAEPIMFDKDEGPREGSSLEKLAKLRAAFKKDGKITAGNASQISDGASAVVLMSREDAEKRGIEPLAAIVDYTTSGLKPELVMEAPIPAVEALLDKVNLNIADIDLIEHNEAFAAASVAVQRAFDIPDERFNVHGGAVALGHPIGASGTRVLTSLLYAMLDGDKNRGIATLCLGGGNAVAMLVAR